MKRFLAMPAIFLASCTNTAAIKSDGVVSCPAIISQLHSRHCELSIDDMQRAANGMTKNYDGWREFTQSLADAAALCAWEQQPDFENSCNEP